MSNHTPDAGIPVLTEVIPVPALPISLISPIPPSPAASEDPVMLQTEQPEPVAAAPLSGVDKVRWEQLERDIRERVLAQVLRRVDTVLEQRVRDCLADVLQSSVDRLAEEIREGLRHSMKEAVARAVSLEIAEAQRTTI